MGADELRQGRARPGHARLARRRARALPRRAGRRRVTASTADLAERALALRDGEAQVDRHPRALAAVALRPLARRRRRPRSTTLTVHVLVLRDGHVGAAPRRTGPTTTRCATTVRPRRRRGRAPPPASAARRPPRAARAAGRLPEPRRLRRRHRRARPRAPPAPRCAPRSPSPPSTTSRRSASGRPATVETAIASSTGLRARDRVTDALPEGHLPRRRGPLGLGRRGRGRRGRRDRPRRDRAPRRGEGPARGAGRARAGRVPGRARAPTRSATLLSSSAGWPSTASPTPRAAARSSGRLGTRVAAPAINLSDSPRFPRTLPRAFDAEGVPEGAAAAHPGRRRPPRRATTRAPPRAPAAAPLDRPRADAGRLAARARSRRTSSWSAAARPTSAELAAPIERGIYVTRLWYVNPSTRSETLLTGMTRDGTFLIEDGRITRPLRDVRFTDSVLRILEATEALTCAPRLTSRGRVLRPPLRARRRVPGAARAGLPRHRRHARLAPRAAAAGSPPHGVLGQCKPQPGGGVMHVTTRTRDRGAVGAALAGSAVRRRQRVRPR